MDFSPAGSCAALGRGEITAAGIAQRQLGGRLYCAALQGSSHVGQGIAALRVRQRMGLAGLVCRQPAATPYCNEFNTTAVYLFALQARQNPGRLQGACRCIAWIHNLTAKHEAYLFAGTTRLRATTARSSHHPSSAWCVAGLLCSVCCFVLGMQHCTVLLLSSSEFCLVRTVC